MERDQYIMEGGGINLAKRAPNQQPDAVTTPDLSRPSVTPPNAQKGTGQLCGLWKDLKEPICQLFKTPIPSLLMPGNFITELA